MALIRPMNEAGITVPAAGDRVLLDGPSGTHSMLLPAFSNALQLPVTPGGRLTAGSGIPITEADYLAITRLYWTPSLHDLIEIYDTASGLWIKYQNAELFMDLDNNAAHAGYHQSGKNYWNGLISDGGTVRLVSSIAWAADFGPNSTGPGVGTGTAEVELFQGRLVNKWPMVARWGNIGGNTVSVPARQMTMVGGFRASANGQTEDSFRKRFVSNIYHPSVKAMRAVDAAASWNLDNTIPGSPPNRQANANAGNQLEVFHCVPGRTIPAWVTVLAANSTATKRPIVVGIGLDSTTVFYPLGIVSSVKADTDFVNATGQAEVVAGQGYHKLVWIEQYAGADVQTIYGTAGVTAGIFGHTLN